MQSKLDRINAIDSQHIDERPVSNNARENTIIDRILDDDGVNFANSIVEELWKDALAAGFDAEELKSIKVGRFDVDLSTQFPPTARSSASGNENRQAPTLS